MKRIKIQNKSGKPPVGHFEHYYNNAAVVNIDIIGDIGWWENNKQSFLYALKSFEDEKEITVNISSLGGDVDAAFAIHDALKNHSAKITADLTGLVASSATIIACGCNHVRMSENALYLIHKPSTGLFGNADDLAGAKEDLDAVEKRIINIYNRRTGLNAKELAGYLTDEKWWDAATALEKGFVDEAYQPGEISNKKMQMYQNQMIQDTKRYELPPVPQNSNIKSNPMNKQEQETPIVEPKASTEPKQETKKGGILDFIPKGFKALFIVPDETQKVEPVITNEVPKETPKEKSIAEMYAELQAEIKALKQQPAAIPTITNTNADLIVVGKTNSPIHNYERKGNKMTKPKSMNGAALNWIEAKALSVVNAHHNYGAVNQKYAIMNATDPVVTAELEAALGTVNINIAPLVYELFSTNFPNHMTMMTGGVPNQAYRMPVTNMSSVIRNWDSSHTPRGKAGFDFYDNYPRAIAADLDVIPGDLSLNYQNYLLTNKIWDPHEYPVVLYLQEQLADRAQHDALNTSLFHGVYNAGIGASGTESTVFNGLHKKINDAITASALTEVATGALTATNTLEKIEAMAVAQINSLPSNAPWLMNQPFYYHVTPQVYQWYKSLHFDVYGSTFAYADEKPQFMPDIRIEGTPYFVTYTPAMGSGTRVIGTFEGNIGGVTSAESSWNTVTFQKYGRRWELQMDFVFGSMFGILKDYYVQVNDQAGAV